jgi:hypothetical protein
VNLPVGAECFIPSVNSGASSTDQVRVSLFLPETHESIAVIESSASGRCPIRSPKPPNPVFYALSITHNKIVPLVLVKVCEPVHFAFNHGKITAKLRFRAL